MFIESFGPSYYYPPHSPYRWVVFKKDNAKSFKKSVKKNNIDCTPHDILVSTKKEPKLATVFELFAQTANQLEEMEVINRGELMVGYTSITIYTLPLSETPVERDIVILGSHPDTPINRYARARGLARVCVNDKIDGMEQTKIPTVPPIPPLRYSI